MSSRSICVTGVGSLVNRSAVAYEAFVDVAEFSCWGRLSTCRIDVAAAMLGAVNSGSNGVTNTLVSGTSSNVERCTDRIAGDGAVWLICGDACGIVVFTYHINPCRQIEQENAASRRIMAERAEKSAPWCRMELYWLMEAASALRWNDVECRLVNSNIGAERANRPNLAFYEQVPSDVLLTEGLPVALIRTMRSSSPAAGNERHILSNAAVAPFPTGWNEIKSVALDSEIFQPAESAGWRCNTMMSGPALSHDSPSVDWHITIQPCSQPPLLQEVPSDDTHIETTAFRLIASPRASRALATTLLV